MKSEILFRYLTVVSVVAAVCYVTRDISPALITGIALAIVLGSTIWLCVSLLTSPARFRESLKKWWALVWDGFWGL